MLELRGLDRRHLPLPTTRTPARRRQRGSALIFCVILITAITVYFVAAQELMMASVRTQARVEERTRANYALESIANFAASEFARGIYTTSSVRSSTYLGRPVSATVTDNDGAIPKTLRMECSAQFRDRTHSATHIRGKSFASPWHYAIVATDKLEWVTPVTTTGPAPGASVYKVGDVTNMGSSHTVNGDLEATGTINPTGITVSGTQWQDAPALVVPGLSIAAIIGMGLPNYPAANLSGYTFTDRMDGTHEVVYRLGNLNMSGTFAGRGTVVVTGNININGNMDYANAGSTLAIICLGDVTFGAPRTTAVGLVYARKYLRPSGGVHGTHFGAIVVEEFKPDTQMTVAFDPVCWNDPAVMRKLHLPGYWP